MASMGSDVVQSWLSMETHLAHLDTYRVFLMVAGVFMNMVTISVVIQRKMVYKTLIMNLLGMNLLASTLSVPLGVSHEMSVGGKNISETFLPDILQAIPIWAINLTIMMISIFRYTTTEYPHVTNRHYQGRWNLGMYLTQLTWVICLLVVILYYVVATAVEQMEGTQDFDTAKLLSEISFLVLLSGSFILPAWVALHVYFRLRCSSRSRSFLAAIAAGDIPIPMPIFSQNMIIVGCCRNIRMQVERYSILINSDLIQEIEDLEEQIRRLPRRRRMLRGFYALTSEELYHLRRLNALLYTGLFTTIPLEPPCIHEFINRYSLAKFTTTLTMVFVLLYTPYCILTYIKEFAVEESLRNYATIRRPFFLLVGQCYILINPVVYFYHHEKFFCIKKVLLKILGMFLPKAMVPKTRQDNKLFIAEITDESPMVSDGPTVEYPQDDLSDIVVVRDEPATDNSVNANLTLGIAGPSGNLGQEEQSVNPMGIQGEDTQRYIVPGQDLSYDPVRRVLENLASPEAMDGMDMPAWV